MTGVQVPPELQPLITLLILLVIFYGAVWIYRKLHPRDDGKSIQGDYNTILNITARHLHLTPGKLDEIVQEATKGPMRRAVAKAAQPGLRAGWERLVRKTSDSPNSQNCER
jgi:hypothetical protein